MNRDKQKEVAWRCLQVTPPLRTNYELLTKAGEFNHERGSGIDMSSDEEYYCTNCGAILNEQYGFDPGKSNWSCTKCGQELYGDDVYEGDIYPGVMWHCDRCDALLNKQNGFTDSYASWTCAECGHLNPISKDAIQ
jgi:ribosomal protein S27E